MALFSIKVYVFNEFQSYRSERDGLNSLLLKLRYENVSNSRETENVCVRILYIQWLRVQLSPSTSI